MKIGGIVGWLAVELDKRHNVRFGRVLWKVLAQAHEQIVHLARLRLGFFVGYLTHGERAAFPTVGELAVPRTSILWG